MSEWLSAHLYYHGLLDQLLVRMVAPVVHELVAAKQVRGAFFLRHWQGGPHVRLRLRLEQGTNREAVQSHLRVRAREFFEAFPCENRIEEGDYQRAASRLAALEPGAEPERLRDNQSLDFVPYCPETEKYGDGASLEAVERHFEVSSRLALSALTGGLSKGRRAIYGFGAVVASAAAGGPDLELLRLRLECGASRWGAGAGFPVERKPPTQLAALRQLARAQWARPWVMTGNPFVDEFRQSIDTLWRDVCRLAPNAESPPRGVGKWPLLPGETVTAAVAVANCAHLVCNRLGLSIGEEVAVQALAAQVAGAMEESG